ncbi:MAG: class I SAM-dependent methyltransferase [Actinomycetota bacterium]
MHVTDRWLQFIEKASGGPRERLAAAHAAWSYMTPVLSRIHTRFPSGARLLELGCGAALHSTLLAAWGYRVTAIDNDPRIVEIARETATTFGQDLDVRLGDALRLLDEAREGYDLVFSFGLVEHFDRSRTVAMLADQGRVASHVMAVIPTKYTRYAAPITDERIYRLAGLKSMFRDAGLTVDDAFVFGDVPTMTGAILRRALPPPVYRYVQRTLGYGMNNCVFGRRGRLSPARQSQP